MDDRSFDRLARLLGEARDRRTGLKALVGGLLGAGTLAALDDVADAKGKGRGDDRRRAADAGPQKRKKTCKPACTDGHVCQKVGRKRRCTCLSGVTCGTSCCAAGQGCVDGQCRAAACDPPCADGFVCEGATCTCRSGIVCGAACCATGQTCQDGTCAGQPEPDACIALGQPCVDTGRACCANLTCASGQGGEADVACYVPQGGACERTAQCVFGTECRDGRCQAPLPPPPVPVDGAGSPCDPVTSSCTAPGTACIPYAGADRPAGTYCLRPAGGACAAGDQCATGRCGYSEASADDARTATVSCCAAEGQACGSNADCCLGATCSGGTCQAGTCDVCSSGCAYATIQDAVLDVARFPAGSTIRIAPGTYFNSVGYVLPWNNSNPPFANVTKPTDYDRNLSFRRCGTEGRVKLGTTKRFLYFSSSAPTPINHVAFAGIEFIGSGQIMEVEAPDDARRVEIEMTDCLVTDFVNNNDGPVQMSQFSDLVMAGCTVRGNISFSGGDSPIALKGDSQTLGSTTLLARDCLFADNRADEGGAIEVIDKALAELRGCTLRQNGSKNDGGALYVETGGKAVVVDSLFEGNTGGYSSSDSGGAIAILGPSSSSPGGLLSLEGTTRIVGNVAAGSKGRNGSGLAVLGYAGGSGVTIADSVTIADNVVTQCALVGTQPNGAGVYRIAFGAPTDCRNWCAPANFIIVDTYDGGAPEPADCAAYCCSGACTRIDGPYGNYYWYCTAPN